MASCSFVRPPSCDGFLEAELIPHPREEYWDAMLKYTNTREYILPIILPQQISIARSGCHLHLKDAITYAEVLIDILKM